MDDNRPVHVEYLGVFQVDEPKDIGWAICLMHDNMTMTRVCKGCFVSATSRIDARSNMVERAVIKHRFGCSVMTKMLHPEAP